MTTPREVKLACDPKLSAEEVTDILRKYHSFPAMFYTTIDLQVFEPGLDQWERYWPLESQIRPTYSGPGPYSLSDPFSNIYRRLRGRVLEWLCNSSRDCSMFWITDPFVIHPELTVARAFTGIFKALNRLGAVVYCFHNMVQREFIFQIISQLAIQYPPYRSLLLKELVDNPKILEKTLGTLFKRLITKPWDVLSTSHPIYLQTPPVIVIKFRWSPGHDNSIEFAEVIQEYAHSHKLGPLLWLVCSHPKDHELKRPFSTIDIRPVYKHETWSCNDTEAKQDVDDLLRNGFPKIRRNHPDVFTDGEKWPSEAQLAQMTRVISGVSPFACTVLHFVGMKGKQPKQCLETCMEYMTGSPAPSALDPFPALDHFYQRFLSSLPPAAMNILSLSISDWRLNACYLANFLEIDRDKLYAIISNDLYPLLDIRPVRSTTQEILELRDSAFMTFFARSGSVDYQTLLYIRQCLRILGSRTISTVVHDMKWKPSGHNDLWGYLSRLQMEVALGLWAAVGTRFTHGEQEDDHLSKFDFRNLAPISTRVVCAHFYKGLVQLQGTQPPAGQHPLVRTKPLFPSDHQLIEKCETVAKPMCFNRDKKPPDADFPQYVLLGRGIQTVLVILTLESSDVAIYSLDMLDDL